MSGIKNGSFLNSAAYGTYWYDFRLFAFQNSNKNNLGYLLLSQYRYRIYVRYEIPVRYLGISPFTSISLREKHHSCDNRGRGGGGSVPFCVLMSLKRRMRAAHGRVLRQRPNS
jgi:hypothetical protein